MVFLGGCSREGLAVYGKVKKDWKMTLLVNLPKKGLELNGTDLEIYKSPLESVELKQLIS